MSEKISRLLKLLSFFFFLGLRLVWFSKYSSFRSSSSLFSLSYIDFCSYKLIFSLIRCLSMLWGCADRFNYPLRIPLVTWRIP